MQELSETTSHLLVLAGIVLILFTSYFIYSLAHKSVSFPTLVLCFLSFGLGFMGIILLPFDLTLGGADADVAISNHTDGTETTTTTASESLSNRSILSLAWHICYWGTSFLGYVVLPLMRETLLSGYFTFASRLRYAFHKSIKTYCLMVLAALVFSTILVIQLKTFDIVPVLITLGNTYGLLLVVVLLGYGLVDVPRMLSRWAKPEVEVRRLCILACKADEWIFDAVWQLQDCEEEIDTCLHLNANAMKQHPNLQTYLTNLLDRRSKTLNLPPWLETRRTKSNKSRTLSSLSPRSSSSSIPVDRNRTKSKRILNAHEEFEKLEHSSESSYKSTLEELARLHARIKISQTNLDNACSNFYSIIQKYKVFIHLVEVNQRASATSLCRSVMEIGRSVVRWIVFRVLAVASIVLSVAVLWSECTIMLPINVSPFSLLLKIHDGCSDSNSRFSDFLIFVESLSLSIPLLYITFCVFSSLMKITAFTNFKCNMNRMTSAVALAFNAQYFVRIQFPLGYNFLLMFKYEENNESSCGSMAFSQLMSNMSTVPFFGTGFNVYAPVITLFFALFTFFNVYARILAWVGVEHEDGVLLALDEDEIEEKVKAGRNIILQHQDREQRELQQHLNLSNIEESNGSSRNGSSCEEVEMDLARYEVQRYLLCPRFRIS